MGSYGNPFGNEDNKQSDCVKIFLNSLAIQKYLCLASYSLSSFFKRNELLKSPKI